MATQSIRTHNLPTDYEQALSKTDTELLPAILARDAAIWTADSATATSIENRLGWLDSPNWAQSRLAPITDFAANVVADGIEDVVLLGMGGSSLAPEVCRDVFCSADDRPRLHVLDDTHPDAVRAVESAVALDRTLFIVASKSGTTTETSCFERYFYQRMVDAGVDAGRHFCAITDPGSALADQAVKKRYRERFLNPADIGGRYSAVSYFGLVPAALAGVDITAITQSAIGEIESFEPGAKSPAVVLAAALGACVSAGKDKLSLIFSDSLKPLGVWVEQLVAESTGKQGVGIVPIVDEAMYPIEDYGHDRVFVVTGLSGDTAVAERVAGLKSHGHAVVEWTVADTNALGGLFQRWEMATALVGALMQINPFDEPNVTESKNKTRQLLLDAGTPAAGENEYDADGINAMVEHICQRSRTGDYFAILAYVGDHDRYATLLAALRLGIGKRLKVATTLGYGPRFLHSTGQLHKGGGDNGNFLQLVVPASQDLEIPGEDYDFARLNYCQALGDFQVLNERNRRVARLDLGREADLTLARLVEAVG